MNPTFFNAVLGGRVSPEVAAVLGDLRAVLFYKDAARTKLRPIGIGEALRRLMGPVLATHCERRPRLILSSILIYDRVTIRSRTNDNRKTQYTYDSCTVL